MTQEEANISETAISEIYKFDGYQMFLRKDNIIQLQFDKGFYGDEYDARNMVKHFKMLKPNEKCLVLVIYEEDNLFSKEAQNYIASKEVSQVVKADALVIKGLALKLMGNFYMKIIKPTRPSRLFNSIDEGIKWLKDIE